MSFVREYYKRAGEPVPLDSPASSGRQSPNSANVKSANSDSSDDKHNKSEQPSLETVNNTENEVDKDTSTKENIEIEHTDSTIAETDIVPNDSEEVPKIEDGSVNLKCSPTITVKVANLTKDNGNESELVTEILGGKKPTVVLEKELPKSPTSDSKCNTPKVESNITQDESSAPINSRRPKRLVRKVVEDKDKKPNEKDKTK